MVVVALSRRGVDHLGHHVGNRSGEVGARGRVDRLHVGGTGRKRRGAEGGLAARPDGPAAEQVGAAVGALGRGRAAVEAHRAARQAGVGARVGRGDGGREGDRLARVRRVGRRGEDRRRRVGVLGAAGVGEVVLKVLARGLVGAAVVLQLNRHAGKVGRGAGPNGRRTRERGQREVGRRRTLWERSRVVRVECGRDALDGDGDVQQVLHREDHAARRAGVERGRRTAAR